MVVAYSRRAAQADPGMGSQVDADGLDTTFGGPGRAGSDSTAVAAWPGGWDTVVAADQSRIDLLLKAGARASRVDAVAGTAVHACWAMLAEAPEAGTAYQAEAAG